MSSLLPALVSGLFIAYGCYVLAAKGFNRISGSFFMLCMATFFWQSTWAVLFTVESPQTAQYLIRFGYVLIAFVPTTLYHFLTEISARRQELRWVAVSYGFSSMFAILSLSSSLFVNGHYHYDWGYYPKAGTLHFLHVLQTALVVSRGLMISWQQERVATGSQKSRLRLCVYSNVIYFLAAVDYLCNYGFGFYPPGVIFIAISLGMLSYAMSKYELMSSYAAAATIAHELRTPLATIRMQAGHAAQQLPQMLREISQARASSGFGGIGSTEAEQDLLAHRQLELMCQKIIQQVDRSNQMIDLILASARMEHIDSGNFSWHSMRSCAQIMLDSYPFAPGQRPQVHLASERDFEFYGSEHLWVFVLSNLIKNSLYAIKAADKGEVFITLRPAAPGLGYNTVTVKDTGSGIPKDVLPHIFDTYYSTKDSAGAGVGLAFCLRVTKAFGGHIRCESVLGEFTTFSLSLPARKNAPSPPQPAACLSAA